MITRNCFLLQLSFQFLSYLLTFLYYSFALLPLFAIKIQVEKYINPILIFEQIKQLNNSSGMILNSFKVNDRCRCSIEFFKDYFEGKKIIKFAISLFSCYVVYT